MQMLQTQRDLCSVELDALLVEASLLQVVEVELEIASIHQRQHQTQRLLGLIGIGQADLDKETNLRLGFLETMYLPRMES